MQGGILSNIGVGSTVVLRFEKEVANVILIVHVARRRDLVGTENVL